MIGVIVATLRCLVTCGEREPAGRYLPREKGKSKTGSLMHRRAVRNSHGNLDWFGVQ